MDLGFRVCWCELPISDFGIRISDPGARSSELGARIPDRELGSQSESSEGLLLCELPMDEYSCRESSSVYKEPVWETNLLVENLGQFRCRELYTEAPELDRAGISVSCCGFWKLGS